MTTTTIHRIATVLAACAVAGLLAGGPAGAAARSVADRGSASATVPAERRGAPTGTEAVVADLHPSFDAAHGPVARDPVAHDPVAHDPVVGVPADVVPPARVAGTGSPPVLGLLGPFPPVELRTLLVAVHLLGLCFGLGGSTLLYFWVFRWVRWGRLPDGILRTFDFVAKTVAVGLVLLWLSGIGFLVSYWLWDPAKLANPKILAKLVIVTALSLNGLLVHRSVSPFVHAAASMPLLRREGTARRLLFIASGTVSGTSWYAAFALGILHEFNGEVPASPILVAWAAAMAAVFLATWTVLSRPGAGRSAFHVGGCGGTARAMVR